MNKPMHTVEVPSADIAEGLQIAINRAIHDAWQEGHAQGVKDASTRALARASQAVTAGLEACDRIITNADGHKPLGPPNPTREQGTACRIRAAITSALDGK